MSNLVKTKTIAITVIKSVKVIKGTKANQKVNILSEFNVFDNFLTNNCPLSCTILEIEMLTRKFASKEC